MPTLYPFTFRPLLKERIWGGQRLRELYNKDLPPDRPIGESWEISDRPGDASVIANGPLAGRDLRWLMENHGAELLGRKTVTGERFPLLIKLLDARETLSLQVHPPAAKAKELGGEPKTEMWYVAAAEPGAELFVGLKRGVTREHFEAQLTAGTVAECFHRVQVTAGDAMFLPSGRVHALGGGLVIFEIQQNSDTTYRVFDWNRVGLDGKPRELHIPQSLASIDFHDFEPPLVPRAWSDRSGAQVRELVQHELFRVDLWKSSGTARKNIGPGMCILGVVSGSLKVHANDSEPLHLRAGQFCLVPTSVEDARWEAEEDSTTVLTVAVPSNAPAPR